MKLWRDMTPEEKGALLLAYHEGKEIQFLSHMSREWEDCRKKPIGPSWADDYAYRVKPKPKQPREFWVVKSKGYHALYNSKSAAEDVVASSLGDEIIHVREVLE